MPSSQFKTQGEVLEAIARRGRGLRGYQKLAVNRAAFLKTYYADVAGEDLRDRDPRTLAAIALNHLSWAQGRRRGAAKIRVFNPDIHRDGWHSQHTIVELVNDDTPFLVDSVTMTLNSLGHSIHGTIHPLISASATGADNVESFIHIEIVRVTDPQLLRSIETALSKTLKDVRAAVRDWRRMRAKLRSASDQLEQYHSLVPGLADESRAFLDWLADDHFTLLGYREYRLESGNGTERLEAVSGTGLGILRNESSSQMLVLTKGARKEAHSRNPLVVTKANARSTVHRPAHLDYVGVKIFDERGALQGEQRFLGLFTSVAYNERPADIPLLRLKVEQVMQRSGPDPRSHRGKALQHILDTLPRDDLFQASVADLQRISTGILNLQERHQIRLFCRRDPFGRFYSCLVYLPRDHYNAGARRRISEILKEGFQGHTVEAQATLSESVLARLHVTVRTEPGRKKTATIDELQMRLVETVRSWSDHLREELLARLPEEKALNLIHQFGDSFPASYQEDVQPAQASYDIQTIARLVSGTGELRMGLCPAATQSETRLRFTTFRCDEPIQIYRALPILENLGFKVIHERPYRVSTKDGAVWIQDFELESADGELPDPEIVGSRFKECFRRVLDGEAENDSFNSFVVKAGLDWREAALLRAYCRYLLQTGIPFSQSYMQEVLARYPKLSHALTKYFKALFDPDLEPGRRSALERTSSETLARELERVVSLDEDRILSAFVAVVKATLRTNFFQMESGAPKPYLSFKLDPERIKELPQPRPQFEIFVYSQRIEGVHLRCGKIARGGLRWSDRREDFRTEILSLMKAQQVKNTVIVPAGAKGGFVCKRLPEGGPEQIRREVVSSYQTFIRGLLDITDNIVGNRVVTPDAVIRRDADDPYLVVAADKGTATFSDIANELAAEYGFWLGDAFASGGSAGYDHKKMGITARGAWEGVKRHFRELGIDVQQQAFTVIGIGDMSGDVFGNGMLLSLHIKLVAAFNHRHIFIDPDPDSAVAFKERERLFALPGSGWDDYDSKKLSRGGGIYSRDSKAIELHADAQKMLGISEDAITPPELIKKILTADADLLWNGGIGTYVKSRPESHSDAGDPANDVVRVDAADLRCRVVGEGGNLGLTQRARIEFALSGGRINTDFIDNSGGVDSSDREVNIKILLNQAMASRRLARSKRDGLLAEMTDEVAESVLASNYAQTQALSMMDTRSRQRLGEHVRLIRVLEARGMLDRGLEFLPSDDQIEERRIAGHGLARPELAILLSYAKIALFTDLVETGIPDEPYMAGELMSYFPERLQLRFKSLITEHRLCREIIAMLIASSMINRMGPFFALRSAEETGAKVANVARAYAAAREIFGVRQLWRDIEALDYVIQAEVQYDIMFQISRMLRRAVYWLLQRSPHDLHIESTVKRFSSGVQGVLDELPKLLGNPARRRLSRDAEQLVQLGLPEALGQRIARLTFMTRALDVVELAAEQDLPVGELAQLYFELARGLKLDWIREQIEELEVEGRWRAMARATLRENLAQEHRALLTRVLAQGAGCSSRDALAAWLIESKDRIARSHQALKDMRAAGQMDFATLSVALKEVGRLI